MCGEDPGGSRLVLGSVGILCDDSDVYTSVQCLSYLLMDQHFPWATLLLILFKKINSFNCMSLILTCATSYQVQLDGMISTGLRVGIK